MRGSLGAVVVVAPAAAGSRAAPSFPVPALAPVANRPLLVHAVEALRRAGVGDVVVAVVAAAAVEVRAALAADPAMAGVRLAEVPAGLAAQDAARAALVHAPCNPVVFQPGEALLAGPLELRDGVVAVPDASLLRFTGTADTLLDLNRAVLDALPAQPRAAATTAADGGFHGRVDVDPTAVVRSSTVRGPVVIGAGAVVEDAFIGPYTAVGAGARVLGAEVTESILLEGAEVAYVGARLERSVVGRSARLYRDLALPRSMQLWVGDGAVVSFA